MSNLLLSKIGHVISEFLLLKTKEVKLFMTLLVKTKKDAEENFPCERWRDVYHY